MRPKKQNKKKNKKGKAAAPARTCSPVPSPPSPAAAAGAAAGGTGGVAGTLSVYNDADGNVSTITAGSPTAVAAAALSYLAIDDDDDRVMEHSLIEEWVLAVAARKVVASSAQIRRCFHGRVDSGLF